MLPPTIENSAIKNIAGNNEEQRKLSVTIYKNERVTTPHIASLVKLPTLSQILTRRAIRQDKSGFAFALHKLKKDGTRRNLDVISRSGIECDVDTGATLDDLRIAIDPYAWTAYSTHNHAPINGKFKFRLVIPFSRDVTPDEWPNVWYGCNELLGDALDPSTKDISRLAYLPSCPKETKQHAFDEYHDGELIGPDMLIALAQNTIPVGNQLALNNSLTTKLPTPPETPKEIERVKSMLCSISSNCDYEKWRNICWAIASLNWIKGFSLFDEWSRRCKERYDTEAVRKVWNSYRSNAGVSFGTLVHHAKQAGWVDTEIAENIETTSNDTSGDIRNGKIYAREFREQLLFVHETDDVLKFYESAGWMKAPPGETDRAGKHVVALLRTHAADKWKTAPEDLKTKRLMAHVERSSSAQKIQAMTNMAKSEFGMTVRLSELDADPMLLGVANGVLKLRTKELLSPSPSLLVTKRCPVPYDPDATAPTFTAFINRITRGKPGLAKFIQRLVGYILTGEVSEQCFAFFFGIGRNGKTTLAELIFWLLGDYATILPTSTLMLAKRDPGAASPDLMLLKGRRLALAVETEENGKFAESSLKAMTGGDTMTARNPYGQYATWTPTHKLLIVGNHRPIISGGDYGIWRRVRLIPFTEIISDVECDENLSVKLRAEGSGVLNWALEGLRDWKQQGLNPPLEVKAAVATYQTDMDILGQWMDDHVNTIPGKITPTINLYRAYSNWARASGWSHPMTRQSFGRRLTERGIVLEKAGSGSKYARGISLNAAGKHAAKNFS